LEAWRISASLALWSTWSTLALWLSFLVACFACCTVKPETVCRRPAAEAGDTLHLEGEDNKAQLFLDMDGTLCAAGGNLTEHGTERRGSE
jgi:hypothetical protein